MMERQLNETKSFSIARNIFIRWMGLMYFFAFISLSSQVLGLVGSEGILPAHEYLAGVENHLGEKSFLTLPTLFWWHVSDQALYGGCVLGIVLSFLVVLGFLPSFCLALLWLLYLSYLYVSQDFLSFQWDILLLEVGFLSIFLSPWTLRLNHSKEPPNEKFLLLLHIVLIKLMLQSGLVKLLSGDPTWTSLRALDFHYMTQPIPNALSWYAHQLPGWIQSISVLIMFMIELIVPFGIFIHRITRLHACWLLMSLQILIMATGNYCFFNLLTIGLCILLLDDRFIKKWSGTIDEKHDELDGGVWISQNWAYWMKTVFGWAMIFFIITLALENQVIKRLGKDVFPQEFSAVLRRLKPFATSNSYGLFAVMTTQRPEIIIEGSMDQLFWKPYELPHKPGNVFRKPTQAAPLQPRLDWQMWFAALDGDFRSNKWFVNLQKRLLEGSPEVLKLFSYNPFLKEPPKYIRARLYHYDFTDRKMHERSHQWWQREYKKIYFPAFSLSKDRGSDKEQ